MTIWFAVRVVRCSWSLYYKLNLGEWAKLGLVLDSHSLAEGSTLNGLEFGLISWVSNTRQLRVKRQYYLLGHRSVCERFLIELRSCNS